MNWPDVILAAMENISMFCTGKYRRQAIEHFVFAALFGDEDAKCAVHVGSWGSPNVDLILYLLIGADATENYKETFEQVMHECIDSGYWQEISWEIFQETSNHHWKCVL